MIDPNDPNMKQALKLTEDAVAAQVSDTPRTEEVAGYGWSGDDQCVSADFARQLERELSAAIERERLANMRADQAEEARDSRAHADTFPFPREVEHWRERALKAEARLAELEAASKD